MNDWNNTTSAAALQKKFSDLFFQPKNMTSEEKQQMMKTFVVSLHGEVSDLGSAINYKDHRLTEKPVNHEAILFKTVDAYRYLLAILNLWEISGEEFTRALTQKDDFLHYRHTLENNKWEGQDVVLFDMDDVLAEFRSAFCEFATIHTGIVIDPNTPEYYNTTAFRENNIDSEEVFREFVRSRLFASLKPNKSFVDVFNDLKSKGFWMQILTARPADSLFCYYDTFDWLARHGIEADSVAFSAEKFRWLSDQEFYGKTNVFAIDDSAKHASEYAKHGIDVIVPSTSYNKEVRGRKNVLYIDDHADIVKTTKDYVDAILSKKHS
jgi:hypothetical protein